MSQPSCDACTTLREYAPEFVMSGVTDNVAASLKNNTGLNPAVVASHRNCEDLQDVNDCLIGRLGQEIESLDVCDWKDFMSRLAPNLYETLKAIIMSDCGQWLRIDSLCALVTNLVYPDLQMYGILPHTYGDQRPGNRGGRLEGGWIYEKNPTSQALDGNSWDQSSVGLRLGIVDAIGCDGSSKKYIWYCPVFINHAIKSNTPVGSLLWSVDKPTALSWGLTEAFWRLYSVSSWTWMNLFVSDAFYGDDTMIFKVTMRVDPSTDRLGLYYQGKQLGHNLPSVAAIYTPDSIERVGTF